MLRQQTASPRSWSKFRPPRDRLAPVEQVCLLTLRKAVQARRRHRRILRQGAAVTDERHAWIRMHAIPIRGGFGALALIAVLVVAMLIELAPLRPLLLAMALGAVFGLSRIVRRRRSGGSTM
jgi:hypothetical protein